MPQAVPVIAGVGKVAGAVGAVKSLTGGGGSAAGQTTETRQVDPETQAMQQDLYRRSQQIAQQPFIPYTGPMVAGFSPDQLRQFQATRGIFESGMAFDPTKGLQTLAQEQRPTVAPVGSLLSADIGAYQSPYQQQVIDATMQDIQRQADIARSGAQERAIRAGAFGGSRSAILEAESQRPFAEVMARTAAEQRERGYGQALRSAESDIARQMQMAQFAPQFELQARQQQAGLLGGLAGQQLQGLGLLGGIGQQQQALQQQAIGAQRGEFQRALAYPQQQLGLLATGVSGVQPTITETGGYKPSGLEKFQAGLGLFETAAPMFTNLYQPKPLPQVNLPQILPGAGTGLPGLGLG
jgi:hypothetical protein